MPHSYRNMFRFHRICGSHIKFSDDFRAAERVSAKSEFNNCVVFSDGVLETNVIFQVRIDKRVSSYVLDKWMSLIDMRLNEKIILCNDLGRQSSQVDDMDAVISMIAIFLSFHYFLGRNMER